MLSVADTYFWLVVVWKLIGLCPFKAMVYFFLFFLCCSIVDTTMVSYFPRASRSSHLPSILPSVEDAYFWLVVVWAVVNWGPSKGVCIFFFIVWIVTPKDGIVSPHTLSHPRTSTQTSPLPLPPTIGWFLNIIIDLRPPKDKALPISLFFYRYLLGAPNKGTNGRESKPNATRLPLFDRDLRHQNLSQWQVLPWR